MKIAFRTKRLRKICEKQLFAEESIGIESAAYLRARLEDINSATCLMELIAGTPQELENGVIQVSIGKKHFLQLKSNHAKKPLLKNKKLDWDRVKRIQILEIGEFSA